MSFHKTQSSLGSAMVLVITLLIAFIILIYPLNSTIGLIPLFKGLIPTQFLPYSPLYLLTQQIEIIMFIGSVGILILIYGVAK
jgi:ABC-type long-subunit fatty acid transport system fused permease/ATPase subunit